MGIVSSILMIPLLIINKLIEFHRQINGRWLQYMIAWIQLKRWRTRVKSNKVMCHDPLRQDIRHIGVLPFEHEWQYDCPDQEKSEDVLIYGVNTSAKQSIKIEIKWKTDSNHNPISAHISLAFDDNDGNSYTLEEHSQVRHRDREYRAGGLAVEILSPFRRKRIRFRGYLMRNGHQLVYVRFNFLWIAMSRVYDFETDFDDHYAITQWIKSERHMTKSFFENRLEQFGQMKGTFEVERLGPRELYFWGSYSKKYLPTEPVHQKVCRVVGYTKQGIGFDLGHVAGDSGIAYRFGLLFNKLGGFKKLTNLQSKNSSQDIFAELHIVFTATFDQEQYEFVIETTKHPGKARQVTVNGQKGMCYLLNETDQEFQEPITRAERPLTRDSSLVLALCEESAKAVELTGGKGSSLAELMGLSRRLAEDKCDNQFCVANGVVVTTTAYQRLLDEYQDLMLEINGLEKLTDLSKQELRAKCENLVNFISNHKLPQVIKQEIETKLKQHFNDSEDKLFAVRSSGASEDSEEMSAAGQMTTFLGVRGLENISESVMKCWSSQFSHIAVEYKRGYGQPVNSPMAVVIQEMVNCESAGVMFTCDPITGDERVIEITANYGLGESVVSAAAEPDTIKLNVDVRSNSLSDPRRVTAIKEKTIGAKKMSIKLSESGGTIEEEITDKDKCCVSDQTLLKLGDLGLRIQRHYGNARDIEWGLKSGQLFMLQSRPVTNLDNSYTDFEIMHEMDTPHTTERDIHSRAHWGENFPGATSWSVFSWTWNDKTHWFRNLLKSGEATVQDYNPFTNVMAINCNQMMKNVTMTAGMFQGYPEDDNANQLVLAFFGHHIEDPEVLELFKSDGSAPRPPILSLIAMTYDMTTKILFGHKGLFKTMNKFMNDTKYDLVDLIKNMSTAKDIFDAIGSEYAKINWIPFHHHGATWMGCNFKQKLLRKVLKNGLDNNPNLEEDFNRVISSCDGVISAEVPNLLREVAKAITNKKRFRELTDEEAVKELRDGSDEASDKFRAFLDKHGIRAYREYDPRQMTWAEDPTPCVKTIKGLLLGSELQLKPKTEKCVDQVMSELKTPLSFVRRQVIRHVLLPLCRSAVGYRELSKHFMIWVHNNYRQGFRLLTKKMVSEGLILNEDTFYFLTIEEIERLCNGERDPVIHTRVRLRRRLYPTMDGLKFDEFIKGPEMRPRITEDVSITRANGSVRLTGTPVSLGKVRARVCVSEDIAEADNIEPGDILITYSTDIGWSPYFPLLSGIVTEIGGTISHGAVIAREYGIPSLIAVEGACRVFRTGEVCLLDTHSQTITKVD